ncbi:spore coat associated protein CotJA [Dorea formicigenerans]|uniref:spore coat associated protein CotJA n=1 Tax=Dorea formicigenerans TaxID=39486 RepID=UPI0032BF6EF2
MNNQELCAGIALDQMPVTMAYVPWTKWQNIYEAEKGLRRGTIFQDLDKPFRGIGGCQNGR